MCAMSRAGGPSSPLSVKCCQPVAMWHEGRQSLHTASPPRSDLPAARVFLSVSQAALKSATAHCRHKCGTDQNADSSSTGHTPSDTGDRQVLRALWSIINNTFKRFRVRKSIVFAIDGVPPIAKLAISQQRRLRAARAGVLSARIEESFRARRAKEGIASGLNRSSEEYNRCYTDGEDCDTSEAADALATEGAPTGKSGYRIRWLSASFERGSTLCAVHALATLAASYLLSPGTYFMRQVEGHCRKFAKQLLLSGLVEASKVFLSGPSSYGEGELKLADWINFSCDAGRSQTQEASSESQGASERRSGRSAYSRGRPCPGLGLLKVKPTDSIVVIGGDADLVVQSLALPFASNLFVYNPQSIASSKTKRVIYSLRSLLGELERLFPGRSHLARNDFALLCILNGNDYLPKIPGFSFARFAAAYEATRRRPECADGAWVDANSRSFDWGFFKVFLEELNKIHSLETAARQREETLRLNGSKPARGVFKASPLQIVHQLFAQKRLVGAEAKDKLPQGAPEASPEKTCVSVASSAGDKKTAQQRAALKLLQLYYPELLHLVEEGPWNAVAAGGVGSSADAEESAIPQHLSPATFCKAAAALRATTPSNTLNNLCLVRSLLPSVFICGVLQSGCRSIAFVQPRCSCLYRPFFTHMHRSNKVLVCSASNTQAALHVAPTFAFTSEACAASVDTADLDSASSKITPQRTDEATALRLPKCPETSEFPKEKCSGGSRSSSMRVDVLVGDRVLFSSRIEKAESQAKARLKHAASMQALQALAPDLYAGLRAQAWTNDGLQSSESVAFAEAEGQDSAAAGESAVGEKAFTVEAHVAHEAEKTAAYLKGLLWNLQMYIDGICPNNFWHFPFDSAPSLLAIQAEVQRQLRGNTAEGRFSNSPAPEAAAEDSASLEQQAAPKPVPQSLYTAALLSQEALHALESRERCSKELLGGPPGGTRAAPLARRLLMARALLETVASPQEDSSPQTQTESQGVGGPEGSAHRADSQKALITATPSLVPFCGPVEIRHLEFAAALLRLGTVLIASKLLAQQAKDRTPPGEGLPSNAFDPSYCALFEDQPSSYWTVFRKVPRDRPSGGASSASVEAALGGPLAMTAIRERRAPIFCPSGANRPWTKPPTDPELCSFSLNILRRPRRATAGGLTEGVTHKGATARATELPQLCSTPRGPLDTRPSPPQSSTGLDALPTRSRPAPVRRFTVPRKALKDLPWSSRSSPLSLVMSEGHLRPPSPPRPRCLASPDGLFHTTVQATRQLAGGALGAPWKNIRTAAPTRAFVSAALPLPQLTDLKGCELTVITLYGDKEAYALNDGAPPSKGSPSRSAPAFRCCLNVLRQRAEAELVKRHHPKPTA
ncbi:uncharacterized protein LOC34617363 [Cyclospora cayetanensis]|uniref:Uncharacterized protein LOC34617363 n=1 Tax=Cyclospora cayetanensis TaxID=88456 RepID=A0A6P6S1W0_9EIME|nr:uncharacterized protein LOC34617363 [Cyclospora cayetanensis]